MRHRLVGCWVLSVASSIGFYSSANAQSTNSWTNSVSGSWIVAGSNGGTVLSGIGYVGALTSNNSAMVTGPGSTWINAGDLLVGRADPGNRLTVTNGGVLQVGGTLYLSQLVAGSNTVTVAGGTALLGGLSIGTQGVRPRHAKRHAGI